MANRGIRLILASSSPRRRELMAEADYEFEVIAPSPAAECGICSRETPPEMVARLAYQKARNVALQIDAGIVIGADTVAECRGHILGKPNDRQHAREMLELLRGAPHQVFTGVCLWQRPGDRTLVKVEKTSLTMDHVSDEYLRLYLDSDAWQGKAGAFGFQDGLDWIHIVEGSESNVVGLPMELLAQMLAEIRTD